MAKAYHYVRFRWWTRVELEQVAKNLSKEFEVKKHMPPSDEKEIALARDDRAELVVRADTLIATLSAFRAVLTQQKAAKFTARDMKLREKVLAMYSRNRSTPFPWSFSEEPQFEATEKA